MWHCDLGPRPYQRTDPEDDREGGSLWIEAPEALLKPDRKTKVVSAVDAVASMNRNITTNNDSNMLVCKVDLLPKLKEIASGAFHACVLGDGNVFIWGAGTKGRLGFGNESGISFWCCTMPPARSRLPRVAPASEGARASPAFQGLRH